uniref:Uncharacterized protein n=1 Tax=Cannabis sativa TaxID=3483 RepID=A0A803NXZ9_CANSA
MADAKTKRALMEGGGNLNQKFSGRLIPKRGQVTMTAVAVLLHSFSSICDPFSCYSVTYVNPNSVCLKFE